MTDANTSGGHLGRSILAVVAGFVVNVGLSLGVDEILHLTGVYPPWGQWTPGWLLALALAYRIVFSVAAAYVTARLAPASPMKHALILGSIGLVLSVAGMAAAWNQNVGPHWYSIAVVLIALPCAWLGAKLRLAQIES